MENDIKELAVIEQLPVITEKFEEISKDVKERTDRAKALVVTEDNFKDIKKVRADLNKEFNAYEEIRKAIKRKIMEKYDEFDEHYQTLIANAFKTADVELKDKINTEEYKIIFQKENELKIYSHEYLDYLNLKIDLSLEQLGVKVNMSDSNKKLREQVKSKLDSMANDIKLIELEDYSSDILVEYNHNGFDFAKAKLTVLNRINEKQRLEQEKIERQQKEQQEQAIVDKVDEIIIPTTVETVDKPVDNILSTRFEVHGTKEQLVNLKKYMTDNAILFWSI